MRTAAPLVSTPSSNPSRNSPPFLAAPPAANGAAPSLAPALSPALMPARAGDHLPIHRLLLAAFHGPTPAEFQAQLDEPGYDPADRLVVKLGERVAAHVRLRRRTLVAAGVQIPAAQLLDLATSAEYRGLGFASSLVAAAERRAREDGVLLGLTRTRAPALFARRGWSVCGRHVFSRGGARQILAQLQATSGGLNGRHAAGADDESDAQTECAYHLLRPDARPAISLRPLRRIELPAVMRLYERTLARRHGSPVRSEAYWEWLLGRGACDRIYVAAEGPESADLNVQLAAIRGAVFSREGRIVELLADEGRCDVAEHLLARVCGDASEQDQWQVRLDAPPGDPLHELVRAAGGQVHEVEECGGEVFMAKALHPRRLLALLGQAFADRLDAAAVERPMQLGLEIQGGAKTGVTHAVEVARMRLVFTSRGMKLAAGPLGRHYLTLRLRDLTPLVLGHFDVADLIAAGRLAPSTKAAAEHGRILFPRLAWWRPPLDDLLA